MTDRRTRLSRRRGLPGAHIVLIGLSALTLFPLLLTVSTTLKDPRDVRVNPFGLF
jgi:ABC-type glycerol-3-phosphate transport system permease component